MKLVILNYKGPTMKTVRVVAAIIIHEKTILATRRNYGEFKDGWEFPGGKIEQGETPEQALKREIKEELEIEICDISFFQNIQYQYETFFLDMDCFTCKIESGEIKLHDHSSAKWLNDNTLDSVKWLPADVFLIKRLQTLLA